VSKVSAVDEGLLRAGGCAATAPAPGGTGAACDLEQRGPMLRGAQARALRAVSADVSTVTRCALHLGDAGSGAARRTAAIPACTDVRKKQHCRRSSSHAMGGCCSARAGSTSTHASPHRLAHAGSCMAAAAPQASGAYAQTP